MVKKWTTDDILCWLRSLCPELTVELEEKKAMEKVLEFITRCKLTGENLMQENFRFPISSSVLPILKHKEQSEIKRKQSRRSKKKRAKAVHRQTSGPSSPQHRQPYPGFIPFFWVPHKWVYVFFFHVGWWWLTFVTSMLEVHQDNISICFVENDVCPANVTMTPTSFVECHQCI